MWPALVLALVTPPGALADPGVRGAKRTIVPLYRPAPDAPKVFVEATLSDGVAGLFLVDTGADTSVLTREAAARLGLAVRPGAARVVGVSGEADVGLARIPWVRLGEVTLRDVQVAVGVPGHRDHYGTMPVDGILGTNVWRHFAMELDYRANRLRLDAAPRRAPGGATPVRREGGHGLTGVQLEPSDPDDHHHAVVLLVDTGANDVLLFGRDALPPTAAVTDGVERVAGIGRADGGVYSLVPTKRLSLASVVVGGARIPVDLDARWVDTDTPLPSAGLSMRGLLGHEVFEGRRLFLDLAGGTIRVRRSAALPRFHDGRVRALALDRARHGDDPARALMRAPLLHDLGRDDEAAAALARLATTPDPALARDRSTARVFLALHQLGEGALEAAAEGFAAAPPPAVWREGALVPAVGALALAGRADAAQTLLDALGADPATDHQIAVARVDLALARGQADAAQAFLGAALVAHGPDTALALRRARVALARGDRDGALAVLRAAALADPTDGLALWCYARLVGPAERPTLAADLRTVIAANHPRLVPHDFVVGAARILDEPVTVARHLAAGLERDCPPGDRARRDNCTAWYLGMAGTDLDRAERLVRRAIRRDGPTPSRLDTLATVLAARGDTTAAAEAARRVLRYVPHDPYARWQTEVPIAPEAP